MTRKLSESALVDSPLLQAADEDRAQLQWKDLLEVHLKDLKPVLIMDDSREALSPPPCPPRGVLGPKGGFKAS